MRRLLLAVFFLLSGTVLFAQTKRMVLVEEATNASCGPCAVQNPTYEAFLASPFCRERAIGITWRAGYPGTDVMNAANRVMHNGRVTYYSDTAFTPRITGVPTAMVNGIVQKAMSGGYDGAPSDLAALSAGISNTPATSPISIMIKETWIGDSCRIKLDVVSTENISSKALRTTAVENYHFYSAAGNNGEKEFRRIPREMFPNHFGEPIVFVANTPQTFEYTYVVSGDATRDQMYFVAFVQDDKTHEVLQAASTEPTLQLVTKSGASFNSVQIVESNSSVGNWDGHLISSFSGDFVVSLSSSLPAVSWGYVVRSSGLDGSLLSDGMTIQVNKGEPFPITCTIDPKGSAAGFGKVTVTLTNESMHQTFVVNYKLYVAGADVLVVMQDEGKVEIPPTYESGMSNQKRSFLILDRGDDNLFDWSKYKVVVFVNGKNIVNQKDVENMKKYMDNGGRLFLTGAEVTWGLVDPDAGTRGLYQDATFVSNYLHCKYKQDTGPNFVVNGAAGDIISDKMQFNISQGVDNQDTPDEIVPLANAIPIFFYGAERNKRVAGLRYADGKHRLVYLGFGLEGIADDAVRGQVLDKGIEWLLGSESTLGIADEPMTVGSLTVKSVYPNPSSDLVSISYEQRTSSSVKIELIDARGQIVLSTSNPFGPSVNIPCADLANGVYLVRVSAGEDVITRSFVVAR